MMHCIALQMGSSFKSAVFADDVAEHIRGWADGARRRNRVAAIATASDAGCLLVAEPSEEATSCTILCEEATSTCVGQGERIS